MGWMRFPNSKNISLCEFFLSGGNGNVIGEFELRENFLATRASGNVGIPGSQLLERKRPFMVRGEDFGIGTNGVLRARIGSRGGPKTKLVRERFFKIPVAIVIRHGRIHP